MRNAFIVTYDISDPRRLRQVFKVMKGHGAHVQLSVFRCELSSRERLRLELRLGDEINHDEDQVLFIDLGPAKGRGHRCIHSVGRPYGSPVRPPFII